MKEKAVVDPELKETAEAAVSPAMPAVPESPDVAEAELKLNGVEADEPLAAAPAPTANENGVAAAELKLNAPAVEAAPAATTPAERRLTAAGPAALDEEGSSVAATNDMAANANASDALAAFSLASLAPLAALAVLTAWAALASDNGATQRHHTHKRCLRAARQGGARQKRAAQGAPISPEKLTFRSIAARIMRPN